MLKCGQLLLRPPELLYAFAVKARNLFWDLGLRKPSAAGVPVVSIGNLSAGGSGKSELVLQLLRLWEDGRTLPGFPPPPRRPGILSRGYGRSGGGLKVVCRGQGPILTPEVGGDEPYMIALRRPETPVVVCADRVAGARHLVEKLGADLILLDDGFQHRRLARDLDLVLHDCTLLERGCLHLLPGGRLREPLQALRRADLVLLNKWHSTANLRRNVRLLRRYYPGPLWIVKPATPKLLFFTQDIREEADIAAPAWAFCGLAHPGDFAHTLERLGLTIPLLSFRDHEPYGPATLKQLRSRLERLGKPVVTTWKDAVKLSPDIRSEFHLQVLEQHWELQEYHEERD